jgi:hypothetical protein
LQWICPHQNHYLSRHINNGHINSYSYFMGAIVFRVNICSSTRTLQVYPCFDRKFESSPKLCMYKLQTIHKCSYIRCA